MKNSSKSSDLLGADLYHASLLVGVTILTVYVITKAWMKGAFILIQDLLDRGLISAETFSIESLSGVEFDLLTLLLTLLSVVAGVMVAGKLFKKRSTDRAIYFGTLTILILSSLLAASYGYASYSENVDLLMRMMWSVAPALVFFFAAKKYRSK